MYVFTGHAWLPTGYWVYIPHVVAIADELEDNANKEDNND